MRSLKKKRAPMPMTNTYYALSNKTGKSSINKPALSLKANVIRHRAVSGIHSRETSSTGTNLK